MTATDDAERRGYLHVERTSTNAIYQSVVFCPDCGALVLSIKTPEHDKKCRDKKE